MVWVATQDDITCPFCRAMDGTIVPIDEPFWHDGDTFEVTAGDVVRSLAFPFDIDHPPLHPFCRCAIVPNIR